MKKMNSSSQSETYQTITKKDSPPSFFPSPSPHTKRTKPSFDQQVGFSAQNVLYNNPSHLMVNISSFISCLYRPFWWPKATKFNV